MSNEKYDWVNALRGYAILLVILVHSSQFFFVSGALKKICERGDLGVQLFFILSSFTLFNSYNNRKSGDEENVKKNFFLRRFFRIAPYYYLAGIMYVFYRLFVKEGVVSVKNLISNFTFTNAIYLPAINDIPPGGWSIGVEMLFYLMIPCLFAHINSIKKAIGLFLFTVVVSYVINDLYADFMMNTFSFIWDNTNPWTLYFWLPNQLPVFLLGIVLYLIYKQKTVSFQTGQISIIVSVLLFVILAFFDFSDKQHYFLIKKEYIYGLIFLFFAIGTYVTKNKLIINNYVQKLGVVSFSMYLNHFIILYFSGYIYSGVNKVVTDYFHLPNFIIENNIIFLILYATVVFLCYPFSKYTYKNVELTGIQFGNKMISKWNYKSKK